jgi:hypothetical protein
MNKNEFILFLFQIIRKQLENDLEEDADELWLLKKSKMIIDNKIDHILKGEENE